jgi:hypothetical protein
MMYKVVEPAPAPEVLAASDETPAVPVVEEAPANGTTQVEEKGEIMLVSLDLNNINTSLTRSCRIRSRGYWHYRRERYIISHELVYSRLIDMKYKVVEPTPAPKVLAPSSEIPTVVEATAPAVESKATEPVVEEAPPLPSVAEEEVPPPAAAEAIKEEEEKSIVNGSANGTASANVDEKGVCISEPFDYGADIHAHSRRTSPTTTDAHACSRAGWYYRRERYVVR